MNADWHQDLEAPESPRAKLPDNAVPGVHSILGQRGSGKSCLLRKVCVKAERLLVIDTLGEHCASGYVEHVDNLSAVALRLDEPRFRIGYCPNLSGDEEIDYLERLVAARYNLTLAIDEIDRWYPSPNSPLRVGLASICNYGRHYGQGLVTTVRRPAAISRHLTAQGVLWVFPMRDDRDRLYVVRNTGVDAACINVLRTNERGHVVETEILRHERRTQVLRFNLQTGDLSESRTVYREPRAEDLQGEPDKDIEETPEDEPPQTAENQPPEAA